MIDLAAVRLTRQKVNAGIWICAGLTMIASAISGVTAFYYLQRDGWGIASGAMTAFAVDVALWVVLTGDRLMEAIGIAAGPWARAVRWGTAGMSVTLNVTAAAVATIPTAAKLPLVVLHVFVPLVMVALAELRGEYARSLAPKEQEALELEEQRKRALDTPIVAPSERISTEIPGMTTRTAPATALSTGRPAAPGVMPAIDTAVPAPASPTVDHKLVHEIAALRGELDRVKTLALPPRDSKVTPLRPRSEPAPRRTVPKGDAPVKDRIIAYLDKHHRGDPYGITADILAVKLKENPHTCKKVLTEWRRGLSKNEAAS